MSETNVPVILTVYNRPVLTAKVFEQIRKARPATLFLVGDGPKDGDPKDRQLVDAVRRIIGEIDWECEVHRNFSDVNLGCRRRMVSGLKWAFEIAEKAIILEDDCVPDPSFFPYCGEMLGRFENEPQVRFISGSNLGYDEPMEASYGFTRFMNMWGWATWRRSFQMIDFKMAAWREERNRYELLDKLLPEDVYQKNWPAYWLRAFDMAISHEVDTWDYQAVFSNLLSGTFAVFPSENMISNIGYGEDATHTKSENSDLSNISVSTTPFPLVHDTGFKINAGYELMIHSKWVSPPEKYGFVSRRIPWGPKEFALIENTIIDHLAPDETFVDIGAHIGQETIPVAKYLNRGGHVWAFEPIAESLARLDEEIFNANLKNVSTSGIGVLDAGGEVDFFLPEEFDLNKDQHVTCMENATPRFDHLGKDRRILRKVRTISLDRFFPVEKIHLIKIDAQGAEPLILKGAKGLLERCRPKIIMEWEDIANEDTDWMFGFVKEIGYDIYDMNGRMFPILRPEEIYCSEISRTNLLLLPTS